MAKSKRSKKDQKMSSMLDKKFQDEYGERFGNEKITRVNVADADLDYSRLAGANKNLYRTIASLIDGLKPGKRRLLYSWRTELDPKISSTKKEALNKRKYYRIDKLASNTTSSYHPHSGDAIEAMLGKEGQYWSNNVMLIDPQGSFGNLRGDEPAAGRYIMARMSEYTIDCFFDDFESYCIPMKETYDGSTFEPEWLPAKYPHILFNPQFSGIGYGLASNIPPFNVNEVLDATIKLLKDPSAKIMLIPDSPTGCDIVDTGEFKEMNKTGIGKVDMKATANIDYVNNIIHISSLPLGSSSDGVIQSILKLRDKKIFTEIEEMNDNTIEGEVSIDLVLSKNAKPEKVLKQLYKRNTGLKVTFPVGITVIDDYAEYEYGIKDLLLAWIDYRIDAVRSMLINKHQILLSDQHINEVLLMVFDKDSIQDRIDEIISISRQSKTTDDMIRTLMKRFKITSVQAKTIAEMKVRNFNIDSYNRYLENKEDIEKEINRIEEMITYDDKLEDFIISQLEEGKKKYGRPRKSKVIKDDDKCNDNIPDTEHLIGISESGFIKKLHYSDGMSIGTVGKTNSNLTVLQVNNRENILVIDSKGNITKISVSAIPDMEYEDFGVELNRFFQVKGDIKAVMELPSMDILKVNNENFGIIFVTKQGLVKKVQISEFKKLTDTKPGIILNDDDEVAVALFALDVTAKDIIISTNTGNGVRLPISEVRNLGATAKGVSMITLKDDEYVVGASLVNPKKKLLFFITSSGRCKITEVKYFPVMKRKSESLSLISLQGTETLIGVSTVDKGDIVKVFKKKGEPEDINIKDLPVSTRISKGDKIIKTAHGDSVVAYKVFTK